MNADLANKLFKDNKDKLNWDIPFPMGVFGTLKKNCGNSLRMGVLKNSGEVLKSEYESRVKKWQNINYEKHSRAFLPHFSMSGLWLNHVQGSIVKFEIYYYDKANWELMIPDVESLEGFEPGRIGGGYHRTLAWLYLLEDNQDYPLELPKNYQDCPKVPAWIYSNCAANHKSIKAGESPIIWTGE